MKILSFMKNEAVLSAALILAVISSFIVTPDAQYLSYIDFRTLSVLFCLMSVMAGLKKEGVFDILARKMLSAVKSVRSLTLILIMLCFFFSMIITNDVALITFVPFTITVLGLLGKKSMLIPVTAMQTVAANLGSMLTPLGNPQNLYLYGISGMSIGSFILLMLPYTAAAFVMLLIWSLLRRGGSEKLSVSFTDTLRLKSAKQTVVYIALFVLCLLTVARLVPYGVTLAAVFAVIFVTDRSTLKNVDYFLLLTFAGFFVFIGNMGRTEAFCGFLRKIIEGREAVTAVAASQVISNVPAALLLSGFTSDISALIIGTNIGGLGTLIASMASLISFKYISVEDKTLRGKYILYFTAVNVIFLAVMIGIFCFITKKSI